MNTEPIDAVVERVKREVAHSRDVNFRTACLSVEDAEALLADHARLRSLLSEVGGLRGLSAEAKPGPLEVGGLDHNDQRIVHGEHGEVATFWHHCVGSLEVEMDANAAFVVAAWNACRHILAQTEKDA